MKIKEARLALQRYYDYGRVDAEIFMQRYPNFEQETRDYLIENRMPELSKGGNADVFVNQTAREALAKLKLVKVS
jgi:hypothetical protein